MGRLSHAHRHLIVSGGGLTPDQAFRQWLFNTYGVREYPLNEASGAVFSGDGLPDGVISGSPQYAVETGIVKSPSGMGINQADDVYVDDNVFDSLDEIVWGGIVYVDGSLDSSGQITAIATIQAKSGEYSLYLFTANMSLAAVHTYATTQALSSTAAYAIKLRTPYYVMVRHQASDNRVDIYINGVKSTYTYNTLGAGAVVTTSNPIYIGSNAGGLQFLDGWQSAVIPAQSQVLTDKDFMDIAVERGMAQYGPDLFDAGKGTFDSGTNDWVQYDNNVLDNVDGALEIEFVDNVTGAYVYCRAAGALQSDLIVGGWYQLSGRVWTNGLSTIRPRVYTTSFIYSDIDPVTATTPQDFKIMFQATNATLNLIQVVSNTAGSGEKCYFDDLVIERLLPTPTISFPFGTDLFDNGTGTLASGTTGFTAQGTNSIANVSGKLKITYDGSNSDGARALLTASGALTTDLTTGEEYILECYLCSDAGEQVRLKLYDGGNYVYSQYVTATSPVLMRLPFMCGVTPAAAQILFDNTGNSGIVYTTMFTLQPVNVTLATPSISGTPTVGETLTASAYGYKGCQWFRNNVAIYGADEQTYVLQAADSGKNITVNVDGKTSAAVAIS